MNAALDDDHVALSINLAKLKTYQNCPIYLDMLNCFLKLKKKFHESAYH